MIPELTSLAKPPRAMTRSRVEEIEVEPALVRVMLALLSSEPKYNPIIFEEKETPPSL